MSATRRYYGPLENLTMTEAEFENCRPTPPGREKRRAFCPFHGSDHQRSLELDTTTGRFRCWNGECAAWGYMDWARDRFDRDREADRLPRWRDRIGTATARWQPPRVARPAAAPQEPGPLDPERAALLTAFQAALPGSPGEAYLRSRGIPPDLARRYGIGYAAPGRWPGQEAARRRGCIVIPHTDVAGRIVSLYGRAVGANDTIPKAERHDHLPGPKGYFNAPALANPSGTVYVCEGAFDALALLAAGRADAVAIFGAGGWRPRWAARVRHLTLALDDDPAGHRARRTITHWGLLRGKDIAVLSPDAYGGEKDAAMAWASGTLALAGPASSSSTASCVKIHALPGDPRPDPAAAPIWAAGYEATLRERPETVLEAGRRRERFTADPRPDRELDADLWSLLLAAAFDVDGHDPNGLCGALHGLRCSGSALIADGGRVRLATGALAAAEYADLRREYLVPHEVALRGLLRAVAAVAEPNIGRSASA
jgi:hypothetical protein